MGFKAKTERRTVSTDVARKMLIILAEVVLCTVKDAVGYRRFSCAALRYGTACLAILR